MRSVYPMMSHSTDSTMSNTQFTEVAASQSAAGLSDGSEEGAPNEGRLTCDRCGRPFNTQRGLSLHQRKAHALEYHLMHVPNVRKAVGGKGGDPAPRGGVNEREF